MEKNKIIEIIENQLSIEKTKMIEAAANNILLEYYQGRVYALEELLQTLWRKGLEEGTKQ